MKFARIRRSAQTQSGIDGILLILSCMPLVFTRLSTTNLQNQPLITSAAVFSCFLFFAAALSIRSRPGVGKFLAITAASTCIFAMLPTFRASPSACLTGITTFFLAIHFLADFTVKNHLLRAGDLLEQSLQRAKSSSIALILLSVAVFLLIGNPTNIGETAIFSAAIFSQILTIIWSVKQQSDFHKLTQIVVNTVTLCLAIYLMLNQLTWAGTLLIGLTIFLLLPESSDQHENTGGWWEPLLSHPARVTLATFFALCLIGAFLLILPGATTQGISALDAAFTSVSAVCVTGLIVLDTPHDFSALGQFFIILLIQLGGLGIMTITTVAMHVFGRRLSLRQERLLNSTFNSDYQTLADSLLLIIKFTAVLETIGAVILGLLFYASGFSPGEAVWKGVFTAISAFCNAGFALQSDSLIPFQEQPLILHTVAILIICGGIAPAVTLAIPRWLQGKNLPVASRLALVTTSILLAAGTVFFLAFEWNGALAGMGAFDKLHNAWFQSVTLRTAGFNSVPIEAVVGPTFLMMIAMMFIGGSPGGTAGGVKTTTIGVLAATFWSSAAGYDDISLQNRRILPQTVFKAVTIVVSGTMLLALVTLMLEATQSINARDLIFEAASALGTVGLSTGATTKLDNIGKIIIMFAMFAGRIGPLTLFTLLSRERPGNTENLIEASINLT